MSSPSTAPCSRLVGLLLLMVGLTVAPAPLLAQASYFNMSAGDYSQNFDDIATWTTPTTGSWQGLATNATGTIPSATRITAGSTSFAATSSSGVQKGTANLQCLATGTTDNTSSTAIDLLLNFAGRNAGNLGFDAATVFNSTGNRVGTLRVYYSTDGASWSEVVGGGLPYAATNNVAGSAAVSVALPSAINNASTTQLRFYYNNGTGGSTGSRPKISLDNVLVTSTPASAGAPVITSPTTDSAVAFQSYSYQITASNSPTSYAASNLPTGLTVNTSTGLISGSPTATGVYSIPIFASNAQGTGGATLTLTVTKNPGAPTITSALTAIGDLGSPFNYQITAENSPTSYSSGTLPAGLSLDTGTGLITGTPTAGGSFNVSITASNSLGSDTKTLVVTINSPPVITSSLSGSLYATNAFGYTITASFSPTSFGASGLPGGWTVDTATGAITSGVTALTLGSTSFQISATNAFGSTSNTYTLAVYDQTTQNAIPLNVVVNKYVNAAVDKVQLLVVGNNTPGSTADLRGMIVKDFSTSMANDSGGKFVFTTNVLWSSVRAGTFISLSAGNTQPEDIDPSDFYLAVNLGNTNYFANGGGSFDIATTDMLMVKQAGSGVSGVAGGIHALAGGTAGAQFTAFTGAKLITTGTSGTELGVVALNSTASLTNFGVSGAVASTDAQGGVAAASLNFASWNNTNNQTYVESLRSAVPTINASPSTLTNLAATQGTPGVSTNFTASASNLSNNITVSANDAVNFAISTNNTDFTNTLTLLTNATGGLSNTPVYVRLTGAAQGAQSTTISLVSGSTSTNVAVSGTVTGTGPASIGLNPTSATNLVAFTGSPGTAQQISVTGTGLSAPIQFTAAPSDQYEVAVQGGSFGVAASLPASGGVALVRIKSGATAGSVGSAQLTFESGSTSNTVAINGTRISGGTGGLEPSLLNFANDLNFTATARFVWVLKSDTVSGRGTEFSGVNVGGNLGVAAGASFDVVLNGAGSSTDFSMDFWKSSRSWLVFSVTGNTTGGFALGAITPDSGGKYYASYGSFSLRTDAGGDVYLDWTPSELAVASISVNPGSLSLPGTTTNVAGASTNFTASGINLTNNITVAAADSVNFAVSTNSANGFAGSLVLTNTGGTVAATPVYVRLTGAANGSFNSAVNLVSGTTSNSVTVSGAVNLPGAATLLPANNTAFSGFTTVRGTNSTNQTFTLSGSNLAAPVTLTPPPGWQISATNSNSFTASSVTIATNPAGVVSNTSIYVRLAGTNASATNYVSSALTLAVPGSLTNNVLLSGSVTDATPVISRTPTSLSGFSTPRGQASTNQSFTLSGSNLTTNITVGPLEGWQVSLTGITNEFGSSLVVTNNPAGFLSNTLVYVRLAGTNTNATTYTGVALPLTSGTASNNVLLSGAVTNAPVAVSVSTNGPLVFSTLTNQASATQSFTAGGSNLSNNITITAPTNFSIAFASNSVDFTNTLTLTNTGGTATNREIFVRLNAIFPATSIPATNIWLTTTGGSNFVTVSGTVTNPPPALTANPASLTNFFAVAGAPSAVTNYSLTGSNLTTNVTVSAPSGFQVALTNTNSAFTNTLSITNSGSISNSIWVRVAANASTNTNLTGNITNTSGALVTNVALRARVVPAPTMSAVPTALSNFTTLTGIASTNQSFNLTASNLLGPVTMTVTNGYEISLNPSNGFTTSLSVSLASAADNASNYGSGSTNTTIAYVGSEAGSPVQNWSDPIVAKSYATGGNLVYGTAGYYQIRPTPSASPSDVNQGAPAGNNLGASATNNPTLYSMPAFAASVTGGAGTFVNFGPHPVFSGPNASALFRQGALSVSVNAGPFNSPAGSNASYFGVPYEFTASTSGSFRIGLVVDAVADGAYAPNYVSLYSAATGTVFSAALVRDGTPDMVFFDVNAKAGDTFTVGLWQNTGTQSVAALSLVTFDNLPAAAAGWTNGANGGTGFGPWSISVDNNPPTYFAGAFVGDPTFAGITGFGTNAFGLYANPANTAAAVSADRPFSSPLKVGETFSFQWAVNWDSGGGNKGFNVYSGGPGGTQLANVNQGDFPGNITFNGANAITNFGTGPMTWSFTMTSSTNLLVTSTARDGSTNIAFTTNIAVSGAPDAARWYTTAMTPGDQRQSYFNNLRIAYTSANITNLPVYVRLATNAPVSEPANSLLSRVSIASPGGAGGASGLSVVNGAFSNLNGLVQQSPEWWNGVPTGWTGVNTNFTVRELDPVPSGNFAANLNTLTTASPFVSLYQAVGTLSTASIVSLNFELIPLIAPTTMSAGIFNTQNSSNYNDWTPLALPASAFNTSGFHTLSTSVAIAAGTPIGIAFWQGSGSPGAPAIDNVSVSPSGSLGTFVSLSGSVADKPAITQSNALVPFSAVQGFPSDAQQFKVGGVNLLTNVLVTPPDGYEVSLDGTGWSASTNVPSLPQIGTVTPQKDVFIRVAPTAPVGPASGDIVLSSTQATNVLVPVSRVVGANTGPQLVATPTVLAAFATDLGTKSTAQDFVLTGSGLSVDVALAAPSGFEISTNATTFVSSAIVTPPPSGYLSNNISVRLAGSAEGIFPGTVTATSGAASASVSVIGTVYADASAKIAALPLSLSNFSTVAGTPSASQSFLGAARQLGATDLVATASTDYEVSTNNLDFFPSVNVTPVAGDIEPVAFYVRIASSAIFTSSLPGTVTLSSGSATPVVVDLAGQVTPARSLSVTLLSPTNSPTIIAPGSTVRLVATVSDTNTDGTPVQVATFEFRTNNVAIPGAFVTNVVSPYTLSYDWTPSAAALPANVSAWAVDVDGWEGSSASVVVRNPDPGEPIVGFTPPVAYPTNSQIEAVAPATNGAFYIGGSFTNFVRTAGGPPVTNPATRVARILADGMVDTDFVTDTGPSNTVRTLLYSATNRGLYIGGVFTNVSGVARPGLARLAVGQTNIDDGTLDTNFAPALGGVSSPIVNAVVQQYDGKILVGGIFTTAGTGTNSSSSANLARFLTNGVRDVSFVPPAPNGEVKSIAVQPDGKILIAGSFAQVAGQARKGLARLNIDGTLDTTFTVGTGTSGGFNGTVWSAAVALDGSIYAGGQFSSFDGRSVYNNMAKLSSTGVLQTKFNYAGALAGGINNVVRNVQMRPGGDILVSGLFTQIANSVLFPTPVAVGRVTEFLPAGIIDATFNPGGAGANNSVLNAATLANGNLVLVGAFTQFNGQSYPRMVVLTGNSFTNPVITSPEFFTIDAGGNLNFSFTSTGTAPYDLDAFFLPRGIMFDPATGKFTGIPLDAGAFDMGVSASKPGGGFGTPSGFRLQVLPKIVPYETWKKVWFTPAEQTNSSVSGPTVSAGNPSGQPNFTVYALSGGDPREDGPWILPEIAPTYFEGQEYMGYTVWRYPLADASLQVQVSGNLQSSWGTNVVTITNTPDYFQVRPTVPMSLTNSQFLRLRISAP